MKKRGLSYTLTWDWKCFLIKDVWGCFGVKQFMNLWQWSTPTLIVLRQLRSQHQGEDLCGNSNCTGTLSSKNSPPLHCPPPRPTHTLRSFCEWSFILNTPPLQEHCMADSEGHIPCILVVLPNSLFMCGFGWSSEDLLKHSHHSNPKLHSIARLFFIWQLWHPRSF